MDAWIEKVTAMPVTDLSISEEFKAMMAAQGFNKLDDLMCLPLIELAQKSWFTKKMVEDLAAFMFNAKENHSF